MTSENLLHSDLKLAKEMLYDKCDFSFKNLRLNSESTEYGACSFELNGRKIEHRISKITPTKTGQFVTIWKRNKNGITEPYDISDDFDFLAIISKKEFHFGQFIFPKSVLANQNILSQNQHGGKRGMRVYPPWDIVSNKQAEKTQQWQTKYFVSVKNDNDLNLIKTLLSI